MARFPGWHQARGVRRLTRDGRRRMRLPEKAARHRGRGLTGHSRSNSPALTAATKACHSSRSHRTFPWSGSRELRRCTRSSIRRASRQPALTHREDFLHIAPRGGRPTGIPLWLHSVTISPTLRDRLFTISGGDSTGKIVAGKSENSSKASEKGKPWVIVLI